MVLPVRMAVATAAPKAPPTVRMIVLMPVATPTSDCGTAPTIRFAIEAKANEIPLPSSAADTMNCHGWECSNARKTNAIVANAGAGRERGAEADASAEGAGERAGHQLEESSGHQQQSGLRDESAKAVAGALGRLGELRDEQEAREHREAHEQPGEVGGGHRPPAQHLQVD